jgi:predicted metal-dependent hydrolase
MNPLNQLNPITERVFRLIEMFSVSLWLNDSQMEVIVKKSTKRKKTIQAKMKNGVMEVAAPADVTEKHLAEVIENFRRRFAKREKERNLNEQGQLLQRARKLNLKYFNGRLEFTTIRYSMAQSRSFGLCYPKRGAIHINGCLSKMPQWVEDYVIVHELAHLVHINHSKEFWELVHRYPKTERAIGYLMAKGIEEV